jgi:hypothetical protein
MRRLGVIALLFLAVVVTRFFLLPESWISAAPHQAATVVREMEKPAHHAGAAACRECHGEQHEAKRAGNHRQIGCENCHGPAAAHAASQDDPQLLPPKHREREFCLACHGFQASRPDGFPQVDPLAHKKGKRCVSCHDAHDPVPDEAVTDCAGCHGRIARTHAMSRHSQVECAECHSGIEQHLAAPRTVPASRPSSRDACAACHDAGSTAPVMATARVDASTHGRAYACWDCHYAHLPEGSR